MDSKTFYYARVSTKEQNLDRQIEAFKKLGADEREIICDKELNFPDNTAAGNIFLNSKFKFTNNRGSWFSVPKSVLKNN